VASGGSFRTIWCQHPYPTKALPIAPLLAKTREKWHFYIKEGH